MRAWLKPVLDKLASFPVIRWGLWRDKHWQKNAKWSTALWAFNTAVFFFALKHFGNAYLALAIRTVFTESQAYAVSKWKLWGERQVSVGASSSLTVPVAVFCFLYHKGTALLLVAVFGLGAIPALIILTAIGVVENPLRYLYNREWAFAEKTGV
jgi:hypothetical protein